MYIQYTRTEFEAFLASIAKMNDVPGMPQDITTIIREQSPGLWERVYSIPTKNRAVDVIVYSSVDVDTHKVRDYGRDRVRIIYRWRTRNGVRYRKGQWRNRVEGLFDNLTVTISNMLNGAFSLPRDNEWVDSPAKVG